MRQFIFGFLALAFALVSTAQAQFGASIPRDIEFFDPTSDDSLPDRLDEIVLPRVQFIFDELLDPQRLSLIEFVTTENVNDMRLNAATRSIIRNHIIAMQQVELAIQFLQANRDQIISGGSQQFNSVFGTVGMAETVAVLAPAPLAGTASLQMGMNMLSLRFQQAAGGNAGGATAGPNVSSQVKAGDVLFVEDPADAPMVNGLLEISTRSQTDGILVRVLRVMGNDPASATANAGGGGGGGGGGGNNMQELILDPQFGSAASTMTAFANARVFRVIRFEEQVDTTRYETVVATFQAMRDSLKGLDPALALTPSQQQALVTPIAYNRRFTDINSVWAPGVAEFTQLNQTVSDFMSSRHPTGLATTRGADRLVRQAGFSNSDSHYHIDRLEDQGNFEPTDFQMNSTFPLLWTEDNVQPRNFTNNQFVLGSSPLDGGAYFNDQQTIFGSPDDPWTQYLGRAFFDETRNHVSDFFDDSIAGLGLGMGIRDAQRPARSQNFLTDPFVVGNTTINVRRRESSILPESATDSNTQRTEFRRWQMILESFGEYSTDLTLNNNAAVGLVGISSLFGGFAPGDLSARDSGNYSRFAALLGGGSLSKIDVRRIEPFGKRGSAGFNPVVSPF